MTTFKNIRIYFHPDGSLQKRPTWTNIDGKSRTSVRLFFFIFKNNSKTTQKQLKNDSNALDERCNALKVRKNAFFSCHIARIDSFPTVYGQLIDNYFLRIHETIISQKLLFVF